MVISPKINDCYIASDYDRSRFDINAETVPVNPAFKLRTGETHCFEKNEDCTFNDVDKAILSQIAIFSTGFCTARTLKERLIMQGHTFSEKSVENSLKRLFKHGLINISRAVNDDNTQVLNTQFYSFTPFGSEFTKFLGAKHSYNAHSIIDAPIEDVKKFAQGAQLLTNFQKNLPVTSFAYRPVRVSNPKLGGIIRPTFTVKVWGEILYIEVIRRNCGWLEHITEKLKRYETTLKDPQVTVILCCEDEEMSKETAKHLADFEYQMDIIFTHDVASFGPNFKHSLYAYDPDFNKVTFEIVDPETLMQG